MVAFPRDITVLRYGWGRCILALECESIDLPSFAVLPDGRVLQNREIGYCDDNVPHSTTMASFDERNGWRVMNRYRFDNKGERVED